MTDATTEIGWAILRVAGPVGSGGSGSGAGPGDGESEA
jgi:hypothetical protein